MPLNSKLQPIFTRVKYKVKDYCPNCHFPLPYKAKFCARCGQKRASGMISLGNLFKQVWFRVLHLESRSLRFMLLLFIPGYVTSEFFSGRQKRYPQPIRFFFIVAFLFLFTLNHLGMGGSTGFQAQKSDKGLMFKRNANADVVKYDFYELGRKRAEFEIMQQEIDSLPPEYRTPLVRKAMDSLLRRTYGDAVDKFGSLLSLGADSTATDESQDSLDLNVGFRSYRVATLDAFKLDADAIVVKYGVKSWLDKVAIRQGLKTLKDPGALMKSFLGSLAWTLLGLVAFMAGVLKLLYLRQKRFYVEHFILLLNEHASMFLLLIAALWVNAVFPLGKLWIPLVVWLLISPVFALRNYYHQSWGITIGKSLVYFIAYMFGFILLFTLGMMIVFFIF